MIIVIIIVIHNNNDNNIAYGSHHRPRGTPGRAGVGGGRTSRDTAGARGLSISLTYGGLSGVGVMILRWVTCNWV